MLVQPILSLISKTISSLSVSPSLFAALMEKSIPDLGVSSSKDSTAKINKKFTNSSLVSSRGDMIVDWLLESVFSDGPIGIEKFNASGLDKVVFVEPMAV